jgi:hypothetical protein
MTWFDSNYSKRMPIAIDNNAGSATTIDGTVTIPKYWDEFWATVRDNGFDVRFTQSDGTTEVNYNRATWDYGARSGVFNIDAIQSLANQTIVIYMYWGNSSAGDGSSSPTISSAKTGEIEVGVPTVPILTLKLDKYGSTIASQQFQKTAEEQLDVWVDCTKMLTRRRVATQYSMRYEEIHAVNLTVETNGSTTASAFDETKTRAIDPGWVRVRVKGGSSGTSYTLIVTITTSLARVIQARAVMKVFDTDEA